MSEELVLQEIRRRRLPLTGHEGLNPLADEAGKARYVLLGEASHGTSEFYTVRAELTKRLITEYGYRFIAVEGDWPSCYTLNRYIKGFADSAEQAAEALKDFNRWPSWMWANREILELAEWLRQYNEGRPEGEKVGFYGLDVYSLWESMDELLNYLETRGGADLEAAKRAFECFEPHGREGQLYGLSASIYGEGCEEEVAHLLSRMRDKWKEAYPQDRENALGAEINAMAVSGGETYYRTMIRHDNESWNVRDRHMVEVLEKLMEFHGEGAKAVVWEHNTHIGDARATDMEADGMVNVGQLLREAHGTEVYAVGFGTYQGTVIAGKSWGAALEAMRVPPAIRNSWEELLHRDGPEDKLFLFGEDEPVFGEYSVPHRAIGVVYHPNRERGNYVPTLVAKRYDAFIYIDRTKALSPIETGTVII